MSKFVDLDAILQRFGRMHRFNRKVWKTREAKPEAEQIAVAVDPIIDAATFDSVQPLLKAKNLRAMGPRVVTGPIFLTGIATARARAA